MRYLLLAICLAICPACSNLYFKSMEQIGYSKTELLMERSQRAYDLAVETSDFLKSAAFAIPEKPSKDAFVTLSQLEALENALANARRKSRQTASKIESVEVAAGALLNEWKTELGDYSSKAANKRSSSEQKLFETEQRLKSTISSLQSNHAILEAIRESFEDKALYLKHLTHNRKLTGQVQEYSELDSLAYKFQDLSSSLQKTHQLLAKSKY